MANAATRSEIDAMKRFVTRACTKIARFFWSWGFLKFILWTITLIILVYVEEDWRGARAWGSTKAEWEAKGESLDYSKFIPLPIPDDQNLGCIALFKLEVQRRYPDDPNNKPQLDDVPLQKALRIKFNGDDWDWYNFHPENNWQAGELADFAKIHQYISASYVKVFRRSPSSNDPPVQWEALFPLIADLHGAATRPYCQFQYDDTSGVPVERDVPLVEAQTTVSKILMTHALLELEKRRPDLALEDLKINFKLADGVRHDPSGSIASSVAVAMSLLDEGVVYNGLAQHLWSDDQLAEIDRLVATLNLLADYQRGLRVDAASAVLDYDWVKHSNSREKYAWMNEAIEVKTPWQKYPFLWPGGWWNLTKSGEVNALLQVLSIVDPKNHRAFPDIANEQVRRIHREIKWASLGLVSPWKARADDYVAFYASSGCVYYVSPQGWADETRIACALERYRLAHNVYPDSLDVLVPDYIAELPHDVINGQPYHYRHRADGTFLLYSVGWNQTDDGGKVVYKKQNPNAIDYNEGDWVWPTPLR